MLSLSKIQFKSNSQPNNRRLYSNHRCAQSIKDTIQKQFTTSHMRLRATYVLCSVYQRYNSKAIHNSYVALTFTLSAVLSLSKIQFKSNSQQRLESDLFWSSCAQSIKDTIQKQFTTRWWLGSFRRWLCSVYQRYNSKAIHNDFADDDAVPCAVFSLSKIQFKSNSQQSR